MDAAVLPIDGSGYDALIMKVYRHLLIFINACYYTLTSVVDCSAAVLPLGGEGSW